MFDVYDSPAFEAGFDAGYSESSEVCPYPADSVEAAAWYFGRDCGAEEL